jgi:hypothetical protein
LSPRGCPAFHFRRLNGSKEESYNIHIAMLR